MSRTFPKISIVTPNYNYGHFLEQTIQSVLNQNYPNLEYVIIDGGSKDNSIEVIKKYEHKLAYWVSEPDGGMYDAINKGFSHCTGDLMAWINSDDMYLPWTFDVVADIFSSLPQVQWISSLQPGIVDYKSCSRWFGKIEGFSKQAFKEGRYAGKNHSSEFIQQESTFWKKSLWQLAGATMSTLYTQAGDFELWNRFYNYSELYGVANPLSLFRINFQQKTFNFEQYLKECSSILNTNNSSPSFKGKLRSVLYKTRLSQLQGLRFIEKKALSYHYQNIVRVNKGNDSAVWDIETIKHF